MHSERTIILVIIYRSDRFARSASECVCDGIFAWPIHVSFNACVYEYGSIVLLIVRTTLHRINTRGLEGQCDSHTLRGTVRGGKRVQGIVDERRHVYYARTCFLAEDAASLCALTLFDQTQWTGYGHACYHILAKTIKWIGNSERQTTRMPPSDPCGRPFELILVDIEEGRVIANIVLIIIVPEHI